jgi:multidrug resistance protein, MATE family
VEHEKDLHKPQQEIPSTPPVQEQPLPRTKLIPSFVAGLQDFAHGESYAKIFGYFWPELISAMMLTAFLPLIDSLIIAGLKSTATYATLTVTYNFVHFMKKLAEGLTIGSIVLCGQYNGLKNYSAAGRMLGDVFWVTAIVGGSVSALLFFGAEQIYTWYGVPAEMVELGAPYLRLQSVGIFFMFVYLALAGFLRGIKNTKVPMRIFFVGGMLFIFFDYALVFGKYGFPAIGLHGSAAANAIQYGVMSVIALAYILLSEENRKYFISLKPRITSAQALAQIAQISWPAILDKTIFAASYLWLGSLVASMGKYALASFGNIKDLERFAMLPAVAFAQVITFMVSNDYGREDWDGIKSNLKKILFLSVSMVALILGLICFFAHYIVPLFDHEGRFTDFTVKALPYVSLLALCDVVQVVLSGAMRGAANVKTVMATRLIVFLCVVFPLSSVIAQLPITSHLLKFFLIYSTFYLGNAIMALVYIYRFRGTAWKNKQVER